MNKEYILIANTSITIPNSTFTRARTLSKMLIIRNFEQILTTDIINQIIKTLVALSMILCVHNHVSKTIILITITCHNLLGSFFTLNVTNKKSNFPILLLTIPVRISLTSKSIMMDFVC